MPSKNIYSKSYALEFTRIALLFIFSAFTTALFGQSYTTIKSGDWNDPSIWSPTHPSGYPTSSDQTITISGSHIVTIPAGLSITADELIVNGTLQISQAAGLTITNGSATDLQLSGTLNVYGTLKLSDQATHTGLMSSNTTFYTGSHYSHLYTILEGVIPSASWNSGSTLEINGYTTFSFATTSGNWSQRFGNVEWNCTLQSSGIKMNGLLQNITGSFSVISTGSSLLELSNNQALTINIAGDVTIANDSRVYFSTAPVLGNSVEALQINIGGTFNYTSTHSAGSETNEGKKTTINIAGDFYMNAPGGKLTLSLKESNTVAGDGTTFNIGGNFNLVAGQIFANDV
ncbi:MAG TPA: hypothetical protein VIM65_24595, partial [Cyclobacteriaceae bacterium]